MFHGNFVTSKVSDDSKANFLEQSKYILKNCIVKSNTSFHKEVERVSESSGNLDSNHQKATIEEEECLTVVRTDCETIRFAKSTSSTRFCTCTYKFMSSPVDTKNTSLDNRKN